MTLLTIDELNNRFSLQQENASIQFIAGKGDIPVVDIKNTLASARISLQGAHLLNWLPKNEDEVIWVSDDAKFVEGKSVRGGIPVCWPWFGAHQNNNSYPSHGFARTVFWKVIETSALATGETTIHFQIKTNELKEEHQKMWPQHTTADYRITVGKSLKLELITTNNDAQDIIIGQALHTYFNVGDITSTQLRGLEEKIYLDKTDGFSRKVQKGMVEIDREVDRIYLNTADDVIIGNQQRNILIKKQGSESTVVWNPWEIVAEEMADLGEQGYLKMLCVESANAAEDSREINPGKYHTLTVRYEVVG